LSISESPLPAIVEDSEVSSPPAPSYEAATHDSDKPKPTYQDNYPLEIVQLARMYERKEPSDAEPSRKKFTVRLVALCGEHKAY
jgi:hypothetical protein